MMQPLEAQLAKRVVFRFVPNLLLLLGFMVAFGLVNITKQFVEAVFAVAGKLVHVITLGGLLGSVSVDKLEQKVVSKLTEVSDYALDRAGHYFHGLADIVVSIGNEIEGLAVAVYLISQEVGRLIGFGSVPPRLGRVERAQRHARARADRLDTRLQHVLDELAHPTAGPLAAGAKVATKPVAARLSGVQSSVLPRLKAVEHAGAIAIPADIAGLRARTRAIEDGLGNAFERIKGLDKLIGAGLLTGAVALALRRLGMGWGRCQNWRNIGKAGCRLPIKALEDLLAGAVDALIVTDLCQLARLVRVAATQARPVIHELVVVANAALCLGEHRAAVDLPLNEAALPTPAAPLTL